MNSQAAEYLAGLAWAHLFPEKPEFSADAVRRALRSFIDEAVVERWLAAVPEQGVEPVEAPVGSIQGVLADEQRRRDGVYFTPSPIAEAMAAAVEPTSGGPIVDPAAGAGRLLAAAASRHPTTRVVGIEKRPLLALAAALALATVRREQGARDAVGDQIYVGDGLAKDERWAELEGKAAAVVANPPYVREKGRRELFRRLEREHPHLAEYFAPRMDLQYLFFHRGASLLEEGGRLILLTSAYWLTATSAKKARADLAQRLSPEAFVRLEEAGVFADAPGQHTLLSVFRRGDTGATAQAVSLLTPPNDWTALVTALTGGESSHDEVCQAPVEAFGEASWTPFVDGRTRNWGARLMAEGTALAELLRDRQGFVSGADRFNARHRSRYDDGQEVPTPGEPIFLFDDGQVPEALRQLGGTVIRPLLRASVLEPNAVIVEPPEAARALYVDGEVGEVGEGLFERHLGRFRPVLERRREVRTGSMPWYRLHWPRDRREQTGPKLVVPRRAPSPSFSLDLSGSCISSDCTYLVAREDVRRPLRYLITLMVTLNSELVARYLREFGKAKGQQLEFYSEPLRTLPVPLRCEEGRLVFVDELLPRERKRRLEERIDAICEMVGLSP